MLIILATFSLTQLVCSQFQEMVHGVFLASQSGSGPAGERRGLVSAQQPETKQGWRHLFLLVNANKVLLALVGLCERWYHRPGRSELFIILREYFPGLRAPGLALLGLSRSLVTARCKSSRLMTLI